MFLLVVAFGCSRSPQKTAEQNVIEYIKSKNAIGYVSVSFGKIDTVWTSASDSEVFKKYQNLKRDFDNCHEQYAHADSFDKLQRAQLELDSLSVLLAEIRLQLEQARESFVPRVKNLSIGHVYKISDEFGSALEIKDVYLLDPETLKVTELKYRYRNNY